MDPRFESWIEELLPLVSDMKHERSTEKEMLNTRDRQRKRCLNLKLAATPLKLNRYLCHTEMEWNWGSWWLFWQKVKRVVELTCIGSGSRVSQYLLEGHPACPVYRRLVE